METEMSKLSRLLPIVLAAAFATAATSTAQARCHKRWDGRDQKWVTHCTHGAPPAAVSAQPAEPGAVPPPPASGPTATGPTDRWWFEMED
jgi:hypothetical protein